MSLMSRLHPPLLPTVSGQNPLFYSPKSNAARSMPTTTLQAGQSDCEPSQSACSWCPCFFRGRARSTPPRARGAASSAVTTIETPPSPETRAGKGEALLFGLNYAHCKDDSCHLNGCINDVHDTALTVQNGTLALQWGAFECLILFGSGDLWWILYPLICGVESGHGLF